MEKLLRPPVTPLSVAIALAASSGERNGTAIAVPSLSPVDAAGARPRTVYGSGSGRGPRRRPSRPTRPPRTHGRTARSPHSEPASHPFSRTRHSRTLLSPGEAVRARRDLAEVPGHAA